MRHLTRSLLILSVAAAVPACGGGGGGGGPVFPAVVLVTESAAGADGNGHSDQQAMSADGRYVAFRSAADNLLTTADTAQADIFRKDLQTGTVLRVSRAFSSVNEASAASERPSISADGRFVAYASTATNLVSPATTAARKNVYLFDCDTLTTTLVSHTFASFTTNAGADSDYPSVASTAGGIAYVAYQSAATDIVNGSYTASTTNIFRWASDTGVNAIMSHDVASTTTGGNASSTRASISNDGNQVAFQSEATNHLTALTDTNGYSDIYVKSLAAIGLVSSGALTRVSLSNAGAQLTGTGGCNLPAISGDGTDVAFQVIGTSIGDASPNDIYIRTNWATAGAGTTEVSIHPTTLATGASCIDPAINTDGTYVVWTSGTVIVNGDNNGQRDVYRRDLLVGTLDRASLGAGDVELTGSPSPASASVFRPAVSSTGAFVCFDSNSTNVITPAPSAFRHIYRRG